MIRITDVRGAVALKALGLGGVTTCRWRHIVSSPLQAWSFSQIVRYVRSGLYHVKCRKQHCSQCRAEISTQVGCCLQPIRLVPNKLYIIKIIISKTISMR